MKIKIIREDSTEVLEYSIQTWIKSREPAFVLAEKIQVFQNSTHEYVAVITYIEYLVPQWKYPLEEAEDKMMNTLFYAVKSLYKIYIPEMSEDSSFDYDSIEEMPDEVIERLRGLTAKTLNMLFREDEYPWNSPIF